MSEIGIKKSVTNQKITIAHLEKASIVGKINAELHQLDYLNAKSLNHPQANINYPNSGTAIEDVA